MSQNGGGDTKSDKHLALEPGPPPQDEVASEDTASKARPEVSAAGDSGLMPSSVSPASDEAPDSAENSSGSHVRWWVSVAVGLVVTVPLGWLLSYGATLPFYLGLFFFALFGLIIGAVVYRFASPGRPYGLRVLIVGTGMIVVLGWGISVVKESRDFPGDVAKDASASRKLRLGGRPIEEYRAEVGQQVREFLRERYPPGGTIGYVRWITASGELSSVDVASLSESIKRGQRGYWWIIRVVFSVALLGFGVGSQTLPLRLRGDSKTSLRAVEF